MKFSYDLIQVKAHFYSCTTAVTLCLGRGFGVCFASMLHKEKGVILEVKLSNLIRSLCQRMRCGAGTF